MRLAQIELRSWLFSLKGSEVFNGIWKQTARPEGESERRIQQDEARSHLTSMAFVPCIAGGSCLHKYGHGSKLNHQGTAGFSPCFHLPGFRSLPSLLAWLKALGQVVNKIIPTARQTWEDGRGRGRQGEPELPPLPPPNRQNKTNIIRVACSLLLHPREVGLRDCCVQGLAKSVESGEAVLKDCKRVDGLSCHRWRSDEAVGPRLQDIRWVVDFAWNNVQLELKLLASWPEEKRSKKDHENH